MKRISRIAAVCAVFFACGVLFSCAHIMGYGMILWDLPEKGLQDGDIVPVYIKSNISHVYVIGLPGTREKIEVPVWQVTDPLFRLQAKRNAKKYREFRHLYAHVVLDGLPVRSEPVNTSKQVYRLRKNETIKLLYKGKGQPVMAGKKALEGKWICVLTQDGTQGWCFSNNLRQFETGKGGIIVSSQTEQIQEEDTTLKDFLSKRWYPDYFATMIRDQHIDPAAMNVSYGFITGAETGTVSLVMPDLQVSRPYAGVTKTPEGTYKYNNIPIVVTIRNPDFAVLQYTNEDGKPEDFNMVTINEDIGELVTAEMDRRTRELEQLRQSGAVFQSSNYGQLLFNSDDTFMWNGYYLLVPSLISSSAGSHGTVSIKYFISVSMKTSYDGILTFRFDGMDKDVNFLYKMEESGIRLEDATGATMSGNTVTGRGISPLVLFFARQ